MNAAIGENTTDDELGGSDRMPRDRPGQYLAENDARHRHRPRPAGPPALGRGNDGPEGSIACAIVRRRAAGHRPADERRPYDAREIIARIVDGSHFLEFKAAFDSDTVCGHAHRRPPGRPHRQQRPHPAHGLGGRRRSSSSCATRAARRWSLQNTTGYMVGSGGRTRGRHQARQQDDPGRGQCALSEVHHRGGRLVRRGNYGMCGRGFDPDFIFSWPSARTAVMGGAQAAMVMEMISRGNWNALACPGRAGEVNIKAMSEQLKRRPGP